LREGHAFGEGVGARMEGVDFDIYKGKDKVLTGYAEQVDIRRDRQFYEMLGVTGTAGSQANQINFSSDKAQYDAIAREMQMTTGVKITNKDLAVLAPTALYSQKDDTVQMKGTVAGTAFKGKLAAQNVAYNLQKSELQTGPIRWQGQLPQVQDAPPQVNTRTAWDIRSDQRTTIKDGIANFTEVRATDGDVLVRTEAAAHNEKTGVLTCSGKVYFYSEKANFVADSAIVDRKTKRVNLSGNVRMLVKSKEQANLVEDIPPFRPDVPEEIITSRPIAPAPDEVRQQKDLDDALRRSDNFRDYPCMIKAEKVDYFYGKGNRQATITGNPEALQEFPGNRWRRLFAHTAKWNGQTEMLRLESEPGKKTVRVKTSIKDNFIVVWAEISVKEDQTELHDWELMGVEGIYMADDEDLPAKGNNPPPPKNERPNITN
jgi:hypothetical protein